MLCEAGVTTAREVVLESGDLRKQQVAENTKKQAAKEKVDLDQRRPRGPRRASELSRAWRVWKSMLYCRKGADR